MKPILLKFSEKDGKLWFEYEERELSSAVSIRTFSSSGIIPEKIIQKGIVAIQKYAKRKVSAEISAQKEKAAKHDAYVLNPDFPVSTDYDGKILEGKIISARNSTLTVKLNGSYSGIKSARYGMFSAMSKRFIFDSGEKFSEDAIESAKALLIEIYKEEQYREKNKATIDLANKLNKERRWKACQ